MQTTALVITIHFCTLFYPFRQRGETGANRNGTATINAIRKIGDAQYIRENSRPPVLRLRIYNDQPGAIFIRQADVTMISVTAYLLMH
jgi:hypothetical protein